MWTLYDTLIEQIDPQITVVDAAKGGWRAMVSTKDSIGLCSLLLNSYQPDIDVKALDQYRGKSLKDVAKLVKSWDNLEAAIGMAAINAYFNQPAKLKALGAKLFLGKEDGGDIFKNLQQECMSKKVATIGHFNSVSNLYQNSCDLTIIEQDPRPGDLPAIAAEFVLADMDYVFITGMTITNKTLPRLLELSAKAKVILTGPSVPLTPLLADFGVNIISGFAIYDLQRAAAAILANQGEQIYNTGYKVLL